MKKKLSKTKLGLDPAERHDLPLLKCINRERETGCPPCRFAILILLFSLFISILLPTSFCEAETVIIPIQSRSATEVLPAVKAMLSSGGRAVVNIRTNSLIITDDYEVIRNIRRFLKRYDVDKKVGQVRVHVRFQKVFSSKSRSAYANGSVSSNHWSVSTGRLKGDGAHVRIGDRKRIRDAKSEYFINVTSGSPAYIATGKNILFREPWVSLIRRYATYGERIVSQRIDTGMDVTPVIIGSRARIGITPRISHTDAHGRIGVIRFTKASTTLTVPLGQWITIGGTGEEQHEVVRAILTSGIKSKKSSLSISLMVETY